ncbi:MAG: hypothetical protein HRS50_01700, partial [Mycoplasmataceae bacterium]|nr:hypothetical protein [Mycoplasmataceae bacterium]
MIKLEIIAWTIEDAKKIEQAGADRIELVVDLFRGGLTPPLDLVKKVVSSVSIPVRVMIRDTDESFIYNTKTMDNHIKYIKNLKDINPEGIVFGSLLKNKNEKLRINYKDLKRVIRSKGDMKLTFHRAFDELEEIDILNNKKHGLRLGVHHYDDSHYMLFVSNYKTIDDVPYEEYLDNLSMCFYKGYKLYVYDKKNVVSNKTKDKISVKYDVNK